MEKPDFALRESILGQLDAMDIMLNGLALQVTAIRRAMNAASSGIKPQGSQKLKQQDFGYTTDAEDDKISEYLRVNEQKEALLERAIKQIDEETNDGEQARIVT